MAYLLRRIMSLFLAILGLLGLIRPVPEDIMSYTPEELALIDSYLECSSGASVSVFAKKGDDEPIFTGTVSDICVMPEFEGSEETGYVKYTAYISFEKTGAQFLSVRGARDADITIGFGELRSEKYLPTTVFEKNVFYRIDVAYSCSGGSAPTFSSSSPYRLSVTYPSFGGVPAVQPEPIADIHLRDPFIMTGADGKYYMTGTYDPVDWS
nr:hypothetical protein [Clostridia bacterium]